MNAEVAYLHRKISAISHRIDEMSVGYYQAAPSPPASAGGYTVGQLIQLIISKPELFTIAGCTFAPCNGRTYKFAGTDIVSPDYRGRVAWGVDQDPGILIGPPTSVFGPDPAVQGCLQVPQH